MPAAPPAKRRITLRHVGIVAGIIVLNSFRYMVEGTTSTPLHFPALYFPVAAGLIALLVDAWRQRRQPWAIPAAMVYLTIAAWYLADLILTPEDYEFIPDSLLNISYLQVAAFLVIYRLALPRLTRRLVASAAGAKDGRRHTPALSARQLFPFIIVLWVILLIYGVAMLHGDLVGALFPIHGRAGELLWQRGAAGDAGASGFIVSTAGYIYALVCASFGVWFILLRPPLLRCAAATLVAVSWPFFLLSGTRSSFLVVCLPMFFAYLFFGRVQIWVKTSVLVVAFGVLNVALMVVITYRGVGFQELISAEPGDDGPESLSGHQGLNMIQELCFTNIYSATHPPAYGTRYLQEAANVIPRVIWPSKPLLGIDYAVWRGFAGGDSDIGVVATISTGMIGGGILNFGTWFGPIAPALLMALWSALLARWWVQRASVLRALLFLVGLGLTFNLGRDITLLVLWPIVFGYFLVRVAEYSAVSNLRPRRNANETKRLAPVLRRALPPHYSAIR